MRVYKCLHIDQLSEGNHALVSIRDEDKYEIMNWRNAQLEILRQQSPLTKEQQEHYFKTTVASLFEKEQPEQILFSFLEDGNLIGYGGLVHIDWEKRTAEISFLTETSRNSSKEKFISDWTNYLALIKKISKDHLHFNAIFTYAYDLRPNLYLALEKAGFKEAKRLKDHVEINGQKKDVRIHTYYLSDLSMRMATEKDIEVYFTWANDTLVRQSSFQDKQISHHEHVKWFSNKLKSPDCFFYLFSKENTNCGQVRIDRSGDEIIIGISIDEKFRGQGLGAQMLNLACSDYLSKFPEREIVAYIKHDNEASLKQFKKAEFDRMEKVLVGNTESYILKRSII